ncbi:MAG: MCP four helix bundle domain-containing protein, partial [Paludibacterium sp.]
MASMKVKHRLTLGFGLVILVIAASMGIAVMQISGLRAGIQETSMVHVPRAKAANDVIDAVNLHARSVRTVLLAEDPNLISSQLQQANSASQLVTDAMNRLAAIPGSEESMRIQQDVQATRVVYRNDYVTFLQLFKDGKKDEARKYLLDHMRTDQLAYMDQVGKLIHLEETQSQDIASQSATDALRAESLLSISAAVALFVSLAAGWLITRSLMKELGGEPAEARQLMQELAAGEITTTLKLKKG